jgi:DNA-directed RNA polymerase subunit RPC12/RpoP
MSNQFPPDGFIAANSAVSGIEVYMPAPPQQEPDRPVVEFNCPQCGAATAYSAKDGGLKCSHCGYYEAPEKPDLSVPGQANEFTLETLKQSNLGWGEPRKELECLKCGAKTTLPVETLTHTCAFCDSNQVIQREAAQDLIKPGYLIPFRFDSFQCSAISKRWLGSSWMTPAEVGKLAELHAFTGVYMPFWAFDAKMNADWEAEVAHTRTENYFDPNTKNWKPHTVTEWKWESGHVHEAIKNLLVIGTEHLSALLVNQINQFQFAELVPCEAKYLAGFQARAYDVPLETAWEQGRHVMREQTRQLCREETCTPQIRNFNMSVAFCEEGWHYYLLPFYIAAYSYQDKVYQVIINGQTGAVAGQRPVDWRKVLMTIAAMLVPGILLGIIGLMTLGLGGVGVIAGGVGFLLLVIGVAFAIWTGIKAQKMDDA